MIVRELIGRMHMRRGAGRRALAVGIALALCAVAADAEEDAVDGAPAAVSAAPELSPETFPRLLERILPTEDESAWRDRGWHATFWDGIVTAHRERKPVLLWAMNGHPLGCT
jgi:hypothetical protein